MKKRTPHKRWLALALAVLLAAALGSADFTARAADDGSGLVRVLLTKLKLTDRVEIALDGSYTLGNIAFQRGSHVTVSCKTGTLVVYYEGMALNAGNSAAFVRHALTTEAENGVRFNGDYYLHPGDVTLTIMDGQLRCVLSAPIEEYLLGVVPYEMSDSFPLEALKAQAVAARTYALSKLGSSQDYDVVDNTNDQAYYGVKASNVNAARAVAETTGMCGYYQGKLAVCYYTASNGGQIETVQNVWGKGDYGYITQHDDPYDVENPESVVKRAKIKKTVASSADLAGLETPLKSALVEKLEAMGYDGELDNIRINGVVSIETFDPMYGLTSKIMTKMRFGLSVSARKVRTFAADAEEDFSIFSAPTATPAPSLAPSGEAALGAFETVPETLYAELSMFSDVEPTLNLSINSGNNEIITATEKEDYFLIESRRYGHGVGMSQRGAQTLGETYKWTYNQILSFYYPGMVLKKTTAVYSLPSPVDAAFLATPGPAATPTPRPTLMPATAALQAGQYKVMVTGIEKNSYLNLRETPDMTAGVLMRLYYGQELIVMEKYDESWLHVRTDSAEGYVMEKFVTPLNASGVPTVTPGQ